MHHFTSPRSIILILSSLFLCAMSLVMLLSLTPNLITIQAIAVALGLVVLISTSFIPYNLWQWAAPFLYGVSLIFITLPSFLGNITRGSARWIQVGPISIQPSEVAKPLLIIFFAYLASKLDRRGFIYLIVSTIVMIIPAVIIFKHPDLGSALLVVCGWLGVQLVAPIPKKFIITALILIGIAAPLSWDLLHDYQRQRIYTFLNPNQDPAGSGYNVIQAQLAVGSGGIWGKGLGRGTQSHLHFLPEDHTDFMFASLAEEFGFIGSLIILVLYASLILSAATPVSHSQDIFVQSLASGLSLALAGQVIINIGMNIGILPVTGITLPLLSYGGSSIVSTLFSIGILNQLLIQVAPHKEQRIH